MFQSIKDRRAEKAAHQKKQAKIAHLSNQLQAINKVLEEKDRIIGSLRGNDQEQSLRASIRKSEKATAIMEEQIKAVKADIVKTKALLASSKERTTAKAIELAATAGHSPKFNQ